MQNLNKIKIAPDSIYEIGQDKVGYFPGWSVKDDSTLYEKVRKLAHSTFDSSKFDISSGIAINNGIVSGFSSGNTVSTTVAFSNSKVFTIEMDWVYNTSSSTETIFTTNNYSGTQQIRVTKAASGNLVVYAPTLLTNVISQSTYQFTNNEKLKIKITYDPTTSTDNVVLQVTRPNGNVITVTNSASMSVASLTTVYFGSNPSGSENYSGSIDLKYVKIINGTDIISGNKTGIDTIKADDFTVEGSPTISDDGVASGFSSGNTVSVSVPFSDTKVFTIEMDWVYNTSSSTETIFTTNNYSGTQQIRVTKAASGNLVVYAPTLLTNVISQSTYQFANNEKLKIKFTYDPTTSTDNVVLQVTRQNGNVIKVTNSLSMSVANLTTVYLGTNPSGAENYSSLIDLNTIKIYLNGDLECQPCLKIPYTEAELNQKVVDVAYRPRVQDLFEQTGYNGYHTIDEDNKNFTLPTHKFSDVIDHKEDADGTVAEQRVDMTVMAYGVAENGTDVNLPIEFADGTSYLVGGVTTSSKTATKFTPSSSGTWFARGKGKI